MKVSVVIPNYNGEKYLDACLKSLLEKTNIPMEVLLIDNGSTDNSMKIAEKYKDVTTIRLKKNYGFCKAVNIGIINAQASYVILLNNDVVIETGFVEELVNEIENKPQAFSIEALMIQYYNTSLVDSAGTYYNALGWAYAKGKDKKIVNYQKERESFAACGGAAIYRKSIFKEIGYFDDRHFAYLEDVDIGYRAKLYGYKNYYQPKAKVYHVGSGSSGSRYNDFKARYSGRNNIFLIYKNMPLLQILLNTPLFIIGFAIKIGFYLKKGYGKAYMKGLIEGLKLCKLQNKIVNRIQPNCKVVLKIQGDLVKNIFYRY